MLSLSGFGISIIYMSRSFQTLKLLTIFASLAADTDTGVGVGIGVSVEIDTDTSIFWCRFENLTPTPTPRF
jgi:hypothetical protein